MNSEIQTLEMVVIEPATVLAAYTEGRDLDDAIQQVRDVVEGFEHDMTTITSRKRTASLAMKVAKVKTGLDAMGKDLTAKWKEQAKKVDNSRKSMREALDALKIEARKPLTDWEYEEAMAEAERQAVEDAEKLAAQIESDHEIGILLNEKLERDKADAKEKEERLAKINVEYEERIRQERENRIAAEAAERATREKDAALRVVLAKEAARLAEEKRVQDEQAKREADQNHRRKINNAVLADMVKAGMPESAGKNLIQLIATGKISHTKIIY